MSNRTLLACLGSQAIPSEFVCRLSVVVTPSTDLTKRGFENSEYTNEPFGSYSLIEGDDCICGVYDEGDESVVGMMLFTFAIRVVNETTNTEVLMKYRITANDVSVFTSDSLLFDGVEDGQECVISIYK